MAVVVEPYRVLHTPNWIGYLDGLVAVMWTSAAGKSASGVLLEQSKGYVAIEWAGMMVVDVYVSPNSDLVAFGEFVDGVGDCMRRYLPRQVLILEDFNAHSSQRLTLVAGCCQIELQTSGSYY